MRTSHLLVSMISLAAVAVAAPQKHPHFDDGGALQWQTKLSSAKVEAGKADKLIFIEYGRAA